MTFELLEPVVTSKTFAIEITTRLKTVEIGLGLAAFRLEFEVASALPLGLSAAMDLKPREGIAKLSDIIAFQEGRTSKVTKVSNVYYATKEFLDTARKLGFNAAHSFAEQTVGQRFREDVYTAIVEDELAVDQLVVINFGCSMLFRLDMSVLPTAVGFDYITGKMHNGAYDLQAVLAAFKDDPRVTFLGSKHLPTTSPVIKDIPHYNIFENQSQCLTFMYGPTEAEALQMWEKMQSYGSDYPSTTAHRAIEDLDLLGLNQFAAITTAS